MTGDFPFPKPGMESFRDSVCAWSTATKHKNNQTDALFRDNIFLYFIEWFMKSGLANILIYLRKMVG